jgi:hypothetical protein
LVVLFRFGIVVSTRFAGGIYQSGVVVFRSGVVVFRSGVVIFGGVEFLSPG